MGLALGLSTDADSAGAAASAAPGGVASSVEPITRTFRFERTITCPVEGSWSVSGSGTVVTDREERSLEMDASGTTRADRCLRRRGDRVLGVNGAVDFTGHRAVVERVLVELVHDIEGRWTVWIDDTEREKTCEVDLHAELEGDVVRITGTFCGREVDRTRQVG